MAAEAEQQIDGWSSLRDGDDRRSVNIEVIGKGSVLPT
jgi:hypothetical protein